MTNTKTLTNAELAEAIAAAHHRLHGISASTPDQDKDIARQHLASLLNAQANRAHGDGPGEDDGPNQTGSDEDGVPFVDDDGTLETWAEYVAKDCGYGMAYQYSAMPYKGNSTWVRRLKSLVLRAPDHYAIADRYWTNTLRRVRR